ncbi:hypothetical protein K461DRAFT_202290, partial [Myriangium duriaei CBS 260.36]
QARKLRFITNQGAPHPKRRRVTAACLTCRKRKIACSGEQPSCNTCTQNKIECAGYAKSSDSETKSNSKSKSKADHSQEQSQRNPSSTPSSSNNGAISDGRATVRTESSVPDGPSTAFFSVTRNRMPYFRWLGPTAIMPGYKQMVVKVNRHGQSATSTTDETGAMSSPDMTSLVYSAPRGSSGLSTTTPLPVESDVRTPMTFPFYDTSSMPPSELITHLCEIFFIHLGCNFPFLQKERFLKDLEAKQVDATLVDAVCSLAARFSTHPLLVEQADENGKSAPSDYGQVFARRAKMALVDTYAVPSIAAIQAALLLAYNEFGESRDSGLWMYLGISIRMTQDLGLQKLEGLRFEGKEGPTPKMVKRSQDNRPRDPPRRKSSHLSETEDEQEVRAAERERIDTFWAVFFLDRVVSSGTGRRSTLRDNDIELSFPPVENSDSQDGWPSPFPALIRIVHLYGRVADLLNSIKEPSDISPDTGKRLADMEARVTEFYSSLSPRLHFEAKNFQRHVKAGSGTNFVLLHFWFHTLIILLHQPTLLKTFEGRMLQLFPNSQQLAMSSAKTIADILSYSQLIDAKASLGNPFTTQPIYIAASAFLRETAERTASSADQSRAPSRGGSGAATPTKSQGDKSKTPSPTVPPPNEKASVSNAKSAAETILEKTLAKHTLLVKRASQDYQLCYQALQALETYWAGTKYILTVLDQKKKGVGDPLLYTAEEGESSLEQPIPAPTFSSPGWRRKLTWAPSTTDRLDTPKMPIQPIDFAFETDKDLSQAIGWTVTGDLNSTNTNLSWHYPPG